jgi:signal transduction histidine kinase
MLFIFLIYDSYKLNQNNTHQNQIKQIVTINKEFMTNNLRYIKNEVEKAKPLFSIIEDELKNIPIHNKINIEQFNDKISRQLNLHRKGLSLSTFKLDPNYKIIQSTSPFDIDYYISVNKNENNTLNSMTQFNILTQSSGVFFDVFDQKIKKFAFFKLKDSTFLGIAIIFEFSKKHENAFNDLVISLHSKLNYRYVIKDSNNKDYTMDLFIDSKKVKSRAQYYENLYNKNPKSIKEQRFIQASLLGEVHSIEKDNILYTYVPLLQKDNSIIPLFADVVLEIESDISSEKVFFQKTYQHIIYFIIMHILMVSMIFYFTTSYHTLERILKQAINKNKDLVKYNKNFIANMVHQIRTPLSVIMSNLSLLDYFNKDHNKYSQQINASITTLSNSYENLSYINSYDSLLYKHSKMNLSDFLKIRVAYFDSTANANKTNLITNINDDIFFDINDMELERIFDNTITNAIKYSYYEETIFITLKKSASEIIFTVKNRGSKIKNKTMLFEKKPKKEKQERLYLGLYVANLIAKKYNIRIVFKRENEFNIFEYHFNNIN